MSDTAPKARRGWRIFVQGRETRTGQPFATIADADEALDRVKTELNGSVEDYDRDALAPALVAVPADCATTTAAPEARRRTRETSR